MQAAIVFDIGGTFIRTGVYTESKGLIDFTKEEVPNFLSPEVNTQTLQKKMLDKIFNTVKTTSKKFGDLQFSSIGIGFPGPIGKNGEVLKAPSIWGDLKEAFPLKQELVKRLHKHKVVVLNDLTASGFRYIGLFSGSFCIFTIGSGVGAKVFRNNEVLLNENGYGGEIGHHYWGVDYCDVPCDCGERGHIAAISSGRGILRINKILKKREKELFKQSLLNEFNDPTTKNLVSAMKYGDEYSLLLLRESIKPIAHSISSIYSSIGIDRYIIIGGFAVALGDIYLSLLKEELKEMRMFGIYDAVDDMVMLGEEDDNNGLIGMGKYIFEI